jgi:intracellular multiplication protein IcmD
MKNKSAFVSLAAVLAFSLMPGFAFAYDLAGSGITIGDIAKNLTKSIEGASTLVTALAYLGAISFGFIGALKWKEHGNQPDRTPLKVPMTYWGISAICAALPEFIGTGIASMWGPSAQLVTQAGGGL